MAFSFLCFIVYGKLSGNTHSTLHDENFLNISQDVCWIKIVIKVQSKFNVFFYVQITRGNGFILLCLPI